MIVTRGEKRRLCGGAAGGQRYESSIGSKHISTYRHHMAAKIENHKRGEAATSISTAAT